MGIIEHTQNGIVVKFSGTAPTWSVAAMITAMRFNTRLSFKIT
jgi:hypothetical protein